MEDCIKEESKGQDVHHLIPSPPSLSVTGPYWAFLRAPTWPLSQSCYQELSAGSHFAWSTCSSLESRGNPGGVQRLDSTSPVSPPCQTKVPFIRRFKLTPFKSNALFWLDFVWWLHNKWKPFFSSGNRPLLGMGGHSSHPPFAHNNRVPSSHPRIPGIFYETFVTDRLIIPLEVELGIVAHM